jgi:hypothetical protein
MPEEMTIRERANKILVDVLPYMRGSASHGDAIKAVSGHLRAEHKRALKSCGYQYEAGGPICLPGGRTLDGAIAAIDKEADCGK